METQSGAKFGYIGAVQHWGHHVVVRIGDTILDPFINGGKALSYEEWKQQFPNQVVPLWKFFGKTVRWKRVPFKDVYKETDQSQSYDQYNQ